MKRILSVFICGHLWFSHNSHYAPESLFTSLTLSSQGGSQFPVLVPPLSPLGRLFKILLIALKERKIPLASPLKRGTLRRFSPFLRGAGGDLKV
jgi:hypothetical protein